MKFAVEKYNVEALGITISKNQKKLADKLNKNLYIKTKLQDYRDINEQFDNIVSI